MSEHYSVISLVVDNEPGVLARVSTLFARKGYNIETVNVGKIPGQELASMLFTVKADAATLEQILKQTERMIHVIHINVHSDEESIVREHILARIKVNGDVEKVKEIANKFDANIVHEGENHLVVELVDDHKKVSDFAKEMRNFDLKEIRRSGINAVTKEGY
jgi:acetolactate synthase-1/3 small subunit